jgi:hypothetical protein
MAVNGLVEATRTDFRIYPNPATTSLTIECSKPGVLYLTDMLGRLQKSVVLHAGVGSMVVDIRDMVSGVYGYTFRTEDYRTTGKIIVTR